MYNSAAAFAKFDIETLFFVFYFQPGTQEQIRASLELKRKGWIYNKKFNTWFKRHSKDQDEARSKDLRKEVNTFVYFDDNDWCKRIKDNLEMDYSLVENEITPYEKED